MTVPSGRKPPRLVWATLAALAFLLASLGFIFRHRQASAVAGLRSETEKSLALTRKPSTNRHAVAPAEIAAANGSTGKNPDLKDLVFVGTPAETEGSATLEGKPASNQVLLFLRTDCPCSLEFATLFAQVAGDFSGKARFIGVFESDATAESVTRFIATAGFPYPARIDRGTVLARSLGLSKAGAFALLGPDRTLRGIWGGCSAPGLLDLLERLSPGDGPLSISPAWKDLPGAPVAGCPLSKD